MKYIVQKFRKWFSYSEADDLVVVDLQTKLIQSMSSREWSRMRNKRNYMIIR